jgi:hypothetical protein
LRYTGAMAQRCMQVLIAAVAARHEYQSIELYEQDEMASHAGPVHTPCNDKHSTHEQHSQEIQVGPFPGFSQPKACAPAEQSRAVPSRNIRGSSVDKRAPGELSNWEKRLNSAQERLQLMRLEREQWYAMASAADSARKRRHTGTKRCELGHVLRAPTV